MGRKSGECPHRMIKISGPLSKRSCDWQISWVLCYIDATFAAMTFYPKAMISHHDH